MPNLFKIVSPLARLKCFLVAYKLGCILEVKLKINVTLYFVDFVLIFQTKVNDVV